MAYVRKTKDIYYGLYDIKNNEQCIFVGTARECAEFMGICNTGEVYRYVLRNMKYRRRYYVAKIGILEGIDK